MSTLTKELKMAKSYPLVSNGILNGNSNHQPLIKHHNQLLIQHNSLQPIQHLNQQTMIQHHNQLLFQQTMIMIKIRQHHQI